MIQAIYTLIDEWQKEAELIEADKGWLISNFSKGKASQLKDCARRLRTILNKFIELER